MIEVFQIKIINTEMQFLRIPRLIQRPKRVQRGNYGTNFNVCLKRFKDSLAAKSALAGFLGGFFSPHWLLTDISVEHPQRPCSPWVFPACISFQEIHLTALPSTSQENAGNQKATLGEIGGSADPLLPWAW